MVKEREGTDMNSRNNTTVRRLEYSPIRTLALPVYFGSCIFPQGGSRVTLALGKIRIIASGM